METLRQFNAMHAVIFLLKLNCTVTREFFTEPQLHAAEADPQGRVPGRRRCQGQLG